MTDELVDSAEQIELQAAQVRLNQAQQNVAKLRQAALDKAAADLAAYKAAKEKKLSDARAATAEIEKKWAEKRQAEEDARKAEEAANKAEEGRLTAELNRREEEKRIIAVKAAEIKKVQDAAHALEIEQQQLETALRQATVIYVEDKPVTLSDAAHPLSFIFRGQARTEEAAPVAVASAPAPVQIIEPARKVHHCVDMATSNDLIALVRNSLHINLNPQRADALSSQWTWDAIMKAATQVIEQVKTSPCGHDQILCLIESLLEANNAQAA